MPKIQVELKDGHLHPVTYYDAERIEDHKHGQMFNITPTGTRSNPHHNLYWSVLRKVCRASGLWPTEKHLHHELKLVCGYYKTTTSPLTGGVIKSTDSISFDSMSQKEFSDYFEAAMEKLAEVLGCDPTDL